MVMNIEGNNRHTFKKELGNSGGSSVGVIITCCVRALVRKVRLMLLKKSNASITKVGFFQLH